jgi:hypothetical protein
MRARTRNRRLLGCALTAAAAGTVFAASAVPVFSADTGTVTATVTAAAPCLTISGASSVDFGTGAFSDAQSQPTQLTKPVGTATLNNCSGAGEQIFARATNATGDAVPPAVWSLTTAAHPCSGGADKFAASTRDAAGDVALDLINSPFVSLDPNEARGVGFSILMPCAGSSGAGQTMSFSYVYTAAEAASDTAIYVSLTGNDTNAGTILAPKRTVAAGVAAAESSGHLVKVAAGTYNEGTGVPAADGVSVLGGYDPTDWSRTTTAVTRIDGSPQAVLADADTGVTLDGLTLRGTAGPSGGSAYGVRAINGSSLTLTNVDVAAGNGASGAAGGPIGANGAAGSGGVPGGGGSCDGDIAGLGGAGGASAIGRFGGAGGNGGSPVGNNSGAAGAQGAGGTPGGAGGVSGDPGGSGANGAAGASGTAGANGSGGVAASQPAATWSGASGATGAAGTNGNGGGGGGGGGAQIGVFVDDGSGNGGGGGGAGGQGGAGGAGGIAGGGSFAVYLFDSSATVTGSTVAAGSGGGGGAGAAGGNGGAGGTGAAGGNACTTEVGRGGNGGTGGAGGHGGGGGGGAGGPSVAVFRRGTSTATVSTSTLTFAGGGLGGSPNGVNGLEGTNLAG